MIYILLTGGVLAILHPSGCTATPSRTISLLNTSISVEPVELSLVALYFAIGVYFVVSLISECNFDVGTSLSPADYLCGLLDGGVGNGFFQKCSRILDFLDVFSEKTFDRNTLQYFKVPEDFPRPTYLQSCPVGLIHMLSQQRVPIDGVGAGMLNRGNDCFLISLLQSLIYIPCFSNYYLHQYHSNFGCKQQECLICAMEDQVRAALTLKEAFSPIALIKAFNAKSSRFKVAGYQEDPQEFLVVFFDALMTAEEENREKHLEQLRESFGSPLYLNHLNRFIGSEEQSPNVRHFSQIPHSTATFSTVIGRMFNFELSKSVTCVHCNGESHNLDFITTYSIPHSDSIVDSLTLDTSEEFSNEPEAVCTDCKKQPNHKRMLLKIYSTPKVLVLHIKRFTRLEKITKPMAFSEDLDLAPFLDPIVRRTDTTYRLNSIVCHLGWSKDSGHYMSFVKSFDGNWYFMNDHLVTKVSGPIEQVTSDYSSYGTPYLFFYVRNS